MADIKNTQEFEKGNQEEVLLKVSENLLPIEQQIKAGGDQHITYEKNKYEHIGSVTNQFPPIRVDVKGKFRPKSVDISGKGSFVNYQPVSYTEEVENTRFPCGTYSVMVGNKYDLSVGNGGIGFSTGGGMRIAAGGRANITSTKEVNIASGEGNVDIKAAQNLSLEADSMNLTCPNQVVVDCNLGVTRNAIINGCAFIDGEVYLHHVTCPAEVQYTGGGIGSFGQLMTGAGASGSEKGAGGTTVIGYADVSFIKTLLETPIIDSGRNVHNYVWSGPDKIPVLVLSEAGTPLASTAGNAGLKMNPTFSVFVYPHEHPFNNIPITFTTGNEQMRGAAAGLNNSKSAGNAKPIVNGYKVPGG